MSLTIHESIMEKLNYFISFGTLLGIYRDKQLIEEDDDIDIYVEIKNRLELLKILDRAEIQYNLEVYPNTSPFFLQISRKVNNEIGLIDFYFYETNKSPKKIIIDRWNFAGKPLVDNYHLHIPTKFIFPTKTIKFKNCRVKVPKDEINLIRYLYGETWNIKLEKLTQYRTHILNNKPKIFYGAIGEFQYLLYKILGLLKIIKFG